MARILLVDDDEDMLALNTMWLSKSYTVDSVSSGEYALRLISQNSYDLVLLDLYMPGMSGADILKHIRENEGETQQLKVAILSGADDGDESGTLSELKPAAVLGKNGGKKALLTAVEGLLDQ